MADPVTPPPADLPLATNGEVKAYDRLGGKITVPKEKIGELYGMGGRIAKKEEVKAQQMEDDYNAAPLANRLAGHASVVLPFAAQNALSATGVAPVRSEVEAFNSGVSSAATLGTDEIAVKAALDAVKPGSGKAYGQHLLDAREAHKGFHTAGQVTGFAAMAAMPTSGAASALGGVSKLGSLAEQSIARAAGGLAARGTIGRALATGGELAVRGGVEGTLYAGADSINEQVLGDHEVAADKVFAAMGTGALYGAAGGAVLGGAGSLAASGGRAALGAARSGIGRALSRGEGVASELAGRAEGAAADASALGKAATEGAVADAKGAISRTAGEAADEAGKAGRFAAEQTGTKVEQEVGALRSKLTEMGSKDTQKGWANEQAWKAIGAGNGLQSTSFAKSAERYLPNGVKDVGEVILRRGIINAEGGLLNAARHGTPEAMLPKIEAELAITGQKIGDMTAASPASVHGLAIGEAINNVAKKYEQSAATQAVGKSLRRYADDLYESLGLGSRPNIPVQDLIRERKALDMMVFENAALDPSLTIQVKRELRGELEGLVMKSMDEASGQLPGVQRAEYKALKHDYTALSIASDAAEDSAARMAKGATFGLTDTLRGGGSIVKTVGSKLVRERGNAAAAVLLSRMADMGTITKAIAAIDDHIGKAASGALAAPRKMPLPEAVSATPVRARADAAMRKWAEVAANPEQTATRAAEAGARYEGTAPMLAGALSQRMTSAAAFMASKMPSVPDPDPFDPHPRPMLTDAQAAEYAAYDYYAEKPTRFFEEAAHGKLTFEGVEVARALMPGAFAEMQQRTIEGLADLIAKKRPPPYLAQQRLGIMLGFPAVPEQRPDHITFLQKNVVGSEKAGQADINSGAKSGPKRPMPTKSQSSTLDRLEGK